MKNISRGIVEIDENGQEFKVGTESKQDAIEDRKATNASKGHNEQGFIEGHGGDQQAAPTRDPQLNIPEQRK